MLRTTLRSIIVSANTEQLIQLPENIRRYRVRVLSSSGFAVFSLLPDILNNPDPLQASINEVYDSGSIIRDTGPLYVYSPTPGLRIEVDVLHTSADMSPGLGGGGDPPLLLTCKSWGPVRNYSPLNDYSLGSIPWAGLKNWYYPQGDVIATLKNENNENTSAYLIASTWQPLNSSIPAGATIRRITVNLFAHSEPLAGSNLDVELESLRLIQNGQIAGTDYVTADGNGPLWTRGSPELRSYSPSADPLWGLSWTPADFGSFSANNPRVVVTVTQPGQAATNEVQRVTLPSTASGGTFTLSFSGQTTAGIAYNASAATVQAALEALSNIAPGDVTVTLLATSDWSIEFTGTYAATDVPLLVGNGTNVTLTGGGSILTSTSQQGGLKNTIYRFTAWNGGEGNPTGPSADAPIIGQVLFNYGAVDDPTNLTDWENADNPSNLFGSGATFYRQLLEMCPHINPGDVSVTEVTVDPYPGFAQYAILVEFKGSMANQDWRIAFNYTGACAQDRQPNLSFIPKYSWGHFRPDPILIDSSLCGPPAPGEFESPHNWGVYQEGGPVNEVQLVTILNTPTGGTFTLTFQGQTTAAIAYNASAATVQAALEALSNIAPGDVVVTKSSSGWVFKIEFQGTYAGVDVQQITATPSFTGAIVDVSVTQEAAAGRNEIQLVTLVGGTSTGEWGLSWDPGSGSEDTVAIAANASAATVLAALEGLATPGPGDFSVSGSAGGPYTVEFTGTYALEDVALLQEQAGFNSNIGIALAVRIAPNEESSERIKALIRDASIQVCYDRE